MLTAWVFVKNIQCNKCFNEFFKHCVRTAGRKKPMHYLTVYNSNSKTVGMLCKTNQTKCDHFK